MHKYIVLKELNMTFQGKVASLGDHKTESILYLKHFKVTTIFEKRGASETIFLV